MLCETGFLAIFLGAGTAAPPAIVFWLLAWLLFRNMFGAGLIKIRGDDCWRELTCLDDHYATQPMPNPLSWVAHHLPRPVHRLKTLGNHFVELAVPFLYFAPPSFASVGAIGTVGFQGWLMLTGNFAWLNALTVVQALAVVGGGAYAALLPMAAPATAPTPVYLQVAAFAVAALVLAKSVHPVRNMLSARQVMNTSFDPLNLVNTYGAFGSITTTRHQLVLEGTASEDPAPEDWVEYEWKGQPVKTDKRPPQWAPYHLRLDWQLWFAAMSPRPGRRQRWLFAFLEGVLAGDAATLSLVGTNPFADEPPARVRVLRYRYRYTTPDERAETGEWWRRKRVGTYVRPTSAAELGTRDRR
jgi:membrane protein implicated in regulation of membrane protease activity